jgi:hypothetical protein
MERKYFALEPGGPPRISVFYEMIGGEFVVSFDKRQAKPGTREELAAGKYYRAPDDSRIFVQTLPLETTASTPNGQPPVPQLQVLRDGKPLPEVRDVLAREQIRNTVGLLGLVGVLDLFLGLWLMRLVLEQSAPGVPRPLITGAILVACAWAIWHHKMWAARVAIMVAGLDLVVSLMMALRGGGSGVLLTIIARTVVILMLLRALESFREIQEAKRMAEAERV